MSSTKQLRATRDIQRNSLYTGGISSLSWGVRGTVVALKGPCHGDTTSPSATDPSIAVAPLRSQHHSPAPGYFSWAPPSAATPQPYPSLSDYSMRVNSMGGGGGGSRSPGVEHLYNESSM